ncbi:MAG: sensor domain-containing diguanylate cyclase [Planctomycetota bacterium]|jgi:diguanylate cyclase (GGDEF)-like protein/PAS domain S-box-containing protein
MTLDPSMFETLLDNLHDGVYYVDRERRILFWNRAAEQITGYGPSEMKGTLCPENRLKHIDQEGRPLCEGGCPLHQTMEDGEVRSTEVFLQHRDGHRVPIVVRVTPIRNEAGEITGAVEIFSDNTKKVELMARMRELKKMAMFDGLTGLPNRRFLEMNIKSRINEVRRYGSRIGLLFIDVDRFKAFNDRFGHQSGDDALRAVSKTLDNGMRFFDLLGRWGGEEFVALVINVKDEDLERIAARLTSLVRATSLEKGDERLALTVTMGATLARNDYTIESFIGRADKLMYLGKEKGGNCIVLGDLDRPRLANLETP